MIILYLLVCLIGSYLFAKLLTSRLELRNEILRLEIQRLKGLRVKDKEDYQDRMRLMNKSFEQYKR
jgi:hypothetical protein